MDMLRQQPFRKFSLNRQIVPIRPGERAAFHRVLLGHQQGGVARKLGQLLLGKRVVIRKRDRLAYLDPQLPEGAEHGLEVLARVHRAEAR